MTGESEGTKADLKAKKAASRKEVFETLGELALPPHGSSERLEAIGGDTPPPPGVAPYTRGIHPTMYRGRLWTMRQYAGFSSAEETNERFRMLLDRGQTGLSVAFDLPTQLGLDSDSTLSVGEVGKVGVAIDSLDDMRLLFKDIPLDEVSTSMTINSPAIVLLAMYVALAEERGIDPALLRGTVQNDILKEYIARGTYVFPPKPSMRLITDLISYCADNLPKWNTISISGYHIREAGSTAVQEVAFTLANALAYVDAALATGLDIDSFAPRLSFFFNCHNDFIEEVSKFRAARKLWHDLVIDRYGAKNPKSAMLRFHTQVAGCSLTAQQPLNNVVRVTIQALAAVMGGTQSLHTNSFDEALGLPTEESVTVALRTQQIIAEESGAADTPDPLGGSWLVEELTERIRLEAIDLMNEIEKLGGPMAAIETGFQQREIHEAAYRYQKQIEDETRKVVGVNHGLMDDDGEEPELQSINPQVGLMQEERLKQNRENRDSDEVDRLLSELRDAANEDGELFSTILGCVKVGCTLGEVMEVLSGVFGSYSSHSGF